MHITVIGVGNIGGTLGAKWVQAGRNVVFGVRPIWVGDNNQVQLVDNIRALWFRLALKQGLGRMLTFNLVQYRFGYL